jgi:hypothetical protein
MAKTSSTGRRSVVIKKANAFRFESVNSERTFEVLDGIAFLDMPDLKTVAQFAGIDPRTAGKILKNALTIGIVTEVGGHYTLSLPYPYKGSLEQKKIAITESLMRLPILVNTRQFLTLGDKLDNALRKAATVIGIQGYNASDFSPLVKWATELRALDPKVFIEDLVDEATDLKQQRHTNNADQKIVFISHSSKDKPIIRQLATDLKSEGIDVWLDEQRILVGESISEKIGQGLAESDYFIIAISEHSVQSEWVKKELNNAIVNEIEKRKTIILPIKLSDVEIPTLIRDKMYADFTVSYKQGFSKLINTIKNG